MLFSQATMRGSNQEVTTPTPGGSIPGSGRKRTDCDRQLGQRQSLSRQGSVHKRTTMLVFKELFSMLKRVFTQHYKFHKTRVRTAT